MCLCVVLSVLVDRVRTKEEEDEENSCCEVPFSYHIIIIIISFSTNSLFLTSLLK